MNTLRLLTSKNLLVTSTNVAAIRLLGLLANLLFISLMGRMFGAEIVGRYSISFILIMLSSILTIQGLQSAIIKFAAGDIAENKFRLAKARFFWVREQVTRNGLICSIILLLLASPLSIYVFNDPLSTNFIRILSICIVPYSFIQVAASFAQSVHKPVLSMALSHVAVPLIAGLLLLAGYYLGWNEWLVPIGYTAACMFVAMMVIILFRRNSDDTSPSILLGKKQKKQMQDVGWPLLWSGIVGVMLGWADTLMLGALSGPEQAGIYAMAFRIAIFASLARQIAIKVALGPFAGAVKVGNFREQQRLMAFVTHLGLIAVIPLVITACFVPELILNIAGNEFRSGALILTIIVIGEFVSLLFGSPGVAMQVNGQERAFSHVVMVAFFINLIMNAVLIPFFGGVGAAIATAITSIFQRLIMSFLLFKKTGVVTLAGVSWLRYLTQLK